MRLRFMKTKCDILAQAEHVRLRFMKSKCDILAQDENMGPELHENEIVQCLHRMKTRCLSFRKMK